jgi:putative CocE/NonD family hydrolase
MTHLRALSIACVSTAAVLTVLGNDDRIGAAQTPAGDTVAITHDVMVPMRDGVRLATDIYFPAKNGVALEGRRPVILERTPYRKAAMLYTTTAFLQNGYIVILQDVRGRYASEGRWQPLRDDVNDGVDTAIWIGAQPWSDGTIGTQGSSYDGGTQHALAIGNAPYVKAMFPRNAMSDIGRYGVRHNGAFELRFANWIVGLGNVPGATDPAETARRANTDPAAVAALVDFGNRAREFVHQLPLRRGATPLKFAPDYEAWLIEAMSHGDYDAFWKDSGSSVVDHLAEYKDVPVYHTTGWYDSWTASVANLNYVSLRKAKKSLQRLIIGPWLHSAEFLNYAGEAQFTDDAGVDLPRMQLAWYNHWLKGVDNGVEREMPVRIYVMGGGDAHKTKEGRIFVGGHWRDEADWPLARAVSTPYYLHANGMLSADRASDPPRTYRFDPKSPVPTIGGNLSSQGNLAFVGAADQRCRPNFWQCTDASPFSSRPDVLAFQTPPLDADLEVTGRLIVNLWASTDGRDTDFTAKLIDVYPPNADFPEGVALNISDSIVRGRYRKGPGKAELLTPGRPYEFTIEMYPTSLLFKRGHRIRLDISSSNFPRFDVNPNTGEPLNNNTAWRVATNTIYVDEQHPSHITLPIIPPS